MSLINHTVIPEMRSIIRDLLTHTVTLIKTLYSALRERQEVPACAGMMVPLAGSGGNGSRSFIARKTLNNLRAATGGLPSFASFLALRINWRKVCAFVVDAWSSNSDNSRSLPSIKLSRQAST